VAVAVPEWKDKGATVIHSVFPKLTLSNEIKNEYLTRDIEIMREYEQDTYRHNRISSGVYLGFKREFEKIMTRAADIKLPTLLHISDHDPIVSSESALRFFEALPNPDKVLKVVEGGKHELYNDIVRADIFKLVGEFLVQFEKR
jgi:alpha-beta hydrolase superfamily lysophospholipase